MLKTKITELLKSLYLKDKKMFLLITAAVIAVLLISVSEIGQSKTSDKTKQESKISETQYEQKLEKRLVEIISQVDGAGKVKVMVKTKGADEEEYLKNKTVQSDANGSSKSEYEYIIVNEGSDEKCVSVTTNYPKIEGVIVVCQGGGNSTIKNEITNAVASLLGISAYNISVLQMKQTEA